MSPRVLALLMLVASLVLLGSTAADWAVVEVERTIDTAQADVVVGRSRATSGAEVAGGLVLIGLVGMLGAGLTARRPVLGSVQIPLGALAGVEAVDALRTLEGATAAPSTALLAAAVLVAAGTEAVRVGLVGGDGARPARADAPSRYTVEAVRGDAPTADDEWDQAVAEPAVADDDEA